MSHRHSLLMLAIVRVIVATLPAAIHGVAPPVAPLAAGPAADVVWIWLRPLAAVGSEGMDAAYDRLRPALLQLRAEGRVFGFQVHPEKGAVRVVAVNGGLDGLAERPEVEIELPHPQPRVPKRCLPAARAASGAIQAQGMAPEQGHTIRGTVRDYHGTPVEDAYVFTQYDDPAYAAYTTDAGGAYTLTVSAAGTGCPSFSCGPRS